LGELPATEDGHCPPLPAVGRDSRSVAGVVGRPEPKAPDHAGLAFLSRRGTPWCSVRGANRTDGVAVQFRGLLKRLGINGRKGLGFYTLRHVFRTVADETKDTVAAIAALHDLHCRGVEKVVVTPVSIVETPEGAAQDDEALIPEWKRAFAREATQERVWRLEKYALHWFKLQFRRLEQILGPADAARVTQPAIEQPPAPSANLATPAEAPASPEPPRHSEFLDRMAAEHGLTPAEIAEATPEDLARTGSFFNQACGGADRRGHYPPSARPSPTPSPTAAVPVTVPTNARTTIPHWPTDQPARTLCRAGSAGVGPAAG
jgi:hypothetical protein